MEQMFAVAPILNQLETLLSSVAAFNAIPRWVVIDENDRILRDPETGGPVIFAGQEPTVGLDPQNAEVLQGKVEQLVIDADMLVRLLEFYFAHLEAAKPAPVSRGEAGANSPAWAIRQLIAETQVATQEPVENHAEAIHAILLMWIRAMRKLDEPIVMFFAPRHRRTSKDVRGIIEFEPSDLVETIMVVQDSNTASDRIILQQAGLELRQAGAIDDEQYYEQYALEDDPGEAIIRKYVQQGVDHIMGGVPAAPGSLIALVADLARGRIQQELMEQLPNLAVAQAEQMAESAQANATANLEAGGNPAEAVGIRQPGIGMSQQLPGEPAGGAAPVPQQPPAVAG